MLQPLTEQVAELILSLMDDAICANLSIRPIKNLEQARQFIVGHGSSQDHRFGICHPTLGLVGSLAWGLFSGDSASISYWISQRYQGQGFGRQAVTLLLNCLKTRGVYTVYADVYTDNLVSLALLDRLGFQIVDHFDSVHCQPIERLMLKHE